ncbi:hypothetical protein ACFPFX_25825 [Streptomyces mauvecolor]|uniref:Uncharacterized protein n=1 Tax=Streptomyces mauvecolor TaxID=58345 RepID=A0ABV9UR88_9ACTN
MSYNQPGPYGPQPPTPSFGPPSTVAVASGAPTGARVRNTVLAVAFTVVVGAVGATGYVWGRGASGPASAAAVSYRVKTPPSIMGGAFVGDANVGVRITNGDIKGCLADGIRNLQAVSASYRSSNPDSEQRVQFLGVWGTIDDPEQAIDRDFATAARTAADKTGNTFVGAPQRVFPIGLGDAVMKCQIYKPTSPSHSDADSTTPLCIWADHDTLGEVTRFDLATGATHLTLDQDADTAARVRVDTRVRAL